jgi:hypothetical protein
VSNKKRLKVTPKNADHDEFSVRRESYMQSINQSIKKAAHQKTFSLVIINDHNPPTMTHLSQSHDWSNHTDGSPLAKNAQTDDDDDDDCCKGYRDGSSCVQKMLRQIIIMLANSNDKTDHACLQRRMQRQMSG